MDYQKNLKYFKSTDTHYYVGLPIFAVGAIFFVMAYIFWTYLFWYQDIVGIVLMIAGALIAFVPRSLRSSEKDIDDAVTEMTKDYEKNQAEMLGIVPQLTRGEPKPLLVGTYVYDENSLLRRGKTDRKFRSDRYHASAFLFTKQGFCISEKIFSLIEDRTEENIREFHYADIDGLFIETHEHLFANGEKTTVADLVIKTGETALLALPVTQSAALDKTLEELNTRIRRFKNA